MSIDMNFAFSVDIILLKNVFISCRYAVGVVRLTRKGIILPPTVSRIRVVSFLRGCIVATRCPYVILCRFNGGIS